MEARAFPLLLVAEQLALDCGQEGFALIQLLDLAPLLGLLGTILGLMRTFEGIEKAGLMAHPKDVSHGVWVSLIYAGAGLAVSIPAHAAYNYLVSRVNSIVLDMERAATEVVHVVGGENPPPKAP